MNKRRYTTEDIENLLTPGCEFHASPGLKERVMKEAQMISESSKRRLLPWIITIGMSAAAIIAVVFTLIPYLYNTEKNVNQKQIVVHTETIPSLPDSLNEQLSIPMPSEQLIAKVNTDNSKITSGNNKIKKINKNTASSRTKKVERGIVHDSASIETCSGDLAEVERVEEATVIPLSESESKTIRVTKLITITEPTEMGNNIKRMSVTYNMLASNLQTLSEPVIDGTNFYYSNLDDGDNYPMLSCSNHTNDPSEEERYLRRIEKIEYLTGKRVEIETAEALVRYVRQIKL